MNVTEFVVYRTIPTSNHNFIISFQICAKLYIVLFLHQTTTSQRLAKLPLCCISYYSYIKPQLLSTSMMFCCVVYRTIPTSNHNYILFCKYIY